MTKAGYSLKLARTLYDNVYRCRLFNENNQPIGDLKIVPVIPTDRSMVPEDAPVVQAYLQAIVSDADINKDNLIDFEEKTSFALLKRFETEAVSFQYCEFYYPSPAFIFEQQDSLTTPLN
ncbi:MAG: hypothetical protein KBS34_01220 [Phascolarctobacterium sp.]|nr:hypothetical protein [Candidatus Phascolarctobacterium equi]